MKTPSFVPALCVGTALFFGTCVCAGAAPLRDWPMVDRDSPPVTIRALQFLLKGQGCAVTADGSFGRSTRAALRQFQHAHQLVAGGATNNPTWEALVPSIHVGSKGPAVKAAQIELRDAGYAVAVDGVFGPKMQAVVRRYQTQTGHTADGVIGLYTWAELLGAGQPEGD